MGKLNGKFIRTLPAREALSQIALRVANSQSDQLDEQTRSSELLEACSLLEAEFSHDQTRSAIYAALRVNRYRADGSYLYRYIRAVYPAFFIYEQTDDNGTDRLYKADYTIGVDGKATIGAGIEVIEQTSYEPVAAPTATLAESGTRHIEEQTISLREKFLDPNGRGLLRIINEGAGSSGIYPKAVLERDIPLIFPAGTQMFADHPTPTQEAEQPERSVRDLVARFLDTPVWMEDGPEGPAPYVNIEVDADWRPFVEAKGLNMGASINAEGTYKLTENGEVEITALTAGNSVDFVTRAGRGGKIVPLKEAARNLTNQQLITPAPASAASATAAPGAAADSISTKESSPMAEEAKPVAATPATDEQIKTLESEVTKLRAYPAARLAAREALKDIALPEGARERIIESQAKAPVLTDKGEIDGDKFATQVKEAATVEATYLAGCGWGEGAWAGGNVAGMGAGASGPVREARIDTQSSGVVNIRASLGLS